MSVPSLTPPQVLALAPDAASAKAGQGLANSAKWLSISGNARAAWGECKGSGAKPYQTAVDLSDLTTRCSCPSRKFPCKHALGLLLLRAGEHGAFEHGEAPAWVTEWLAGRAARQNAKAEKAAQKADKTVDDDAKAKRAQARDQKIRAGLHELSLWLQDLVRTGLASANTHPYAYWEAMAARMVDAQAPGVARLVRELPGVTASGEGWPERLLARLAQLHLLTEGYRRSHELPEDVAAELRGVIGWTPDTAEVLTQPAARDEWAVLGQSTEQDDRLTARRTWLRSASGRDALILDFAHASGTLSPPLPMNTTIDAELCYYPGALPLRAAVKRLHATTPLCSAHGEPTIADALRRFAGALARNPWLERYPLTIHDVSLTSTGQGWQLQDAQSSVLPIQAAFTHGWPLLAHTGGRPFTVHGEWNGRALLPLSAAQGSAWLPLPTSQVGR